MASHVTPAPGSAGPMTRHCENDLKNKFFRYNCETDKIVDDG